MTPKHFLTGEEYSPVQLKNLIANAIALKGRGAIDGADCLKGKSIALIFDKPSLRTRVSFTVGVQQLGGQPIEIAALNTKKEDPEDSVRVLQGYVDGIMWRTFAHENLERMVTHSKIPIINGLSDLHHPCQGLADLQTLTERFGSIEGLPVTYIGDGNNILHSLLLMGPALGMDLRFSCPKGFQPDPKIFACAKKIAAENGGKVTAYDRPEDAVYGSKAVYTDVWASMGAESEELARIKVFTPFQLNAALFSKAASDAVIMHCLPMKKGQEITVDMAEHERSVLFQQSENRLHAQKALLIDLFSGFAKTKDQLNVTTPTRESRDTGYAG